jgi:hypothetical protein
MMHVLKTLASYQEDPKEAKWFLLDFMAQHWRFLTQVTAVDSLWP